jgi:2-methylisocitrate lyase-like PEP mutase family enzyme
VASSETQSAGARFRALIDGPDVLLLPGVHSALSARIAERAGARAAYLSGSAVSMSLFGLPDIGLMTGTEMIDEARRVVMSTTLPIICDADTGYGNAVNVLRTVRMYEAAAVAGVQIEDQTFPKRCGHFDGKSLISREEMVGKVRAAVAARRDPDFVIIARTDAFEESGVSEAIERGLAYAEAGADVIFVEAPQTEADLRRIGEAIRVPLIVNVVEGGKTPQLPLDTYARMGYRIVLYPTTNVRVVARALDEYYRYLVTTGTSAGLPHGMLGFDERNELNELSRYQEWEQTYLPMRKEGG